MEKQCTSLWPIYWHIHTEQGILIICYFLWVNPKCPPVDQLHQSQPVSFLKIWFPGPKPQRSWLNISDFLPRKSSIIMLVKSSFVGFKNSKISGLNKIEFWGFSPSKRIEVDNQSCFPWYSFPRCLSFCCIRWPSTLAIKSAFQRTWWGGHRVKAFPAEFLPTF